MKEVIILGSGYSHDFCRYHTEVWGVNFVYTFARRLDKLFFTDEIEEVEKCDYPLLDRLRELNPALVFPTIYPKFKDFGLPIEIYPIKEIRERFKNTEFFANSICYMIAYALYFNYDKIRLCGIDYDWHEGTEKKEESGTNFWVGVAVGMGVNVVIPEDSAIGKTFNRRMYGELGIDRNKIKVGEYTGWDN